MKTKRFQAYACLCIAALLVIPDVAARDDVPAGDEVMRAMVDELNRSMTLQLEDLAKPYFIQYGVSETVTFQARASYGALISSGESKSRSFQGQVRVGSYELDNTNFAGGGGFRRGRRGGRGGGQTALPIDDDYMALRQAIWAATDRSYKSAVEQLTEKQAYLEDRNVEDRPNDFTPNEPVQSIQPKAELQVDQKIWESHLRTVSARFAHHTHLQSGEARLVAEAENRYLINSEGTRIRDGQTRVALLLSAQAQADDGEILSEQRVHVVENAQELSQADELVAQVDELAQELKQRLEAPVLESYTGPVLFDSVASGQVFREFLATGIASQPDRVGVRRRRARGGADLSNYLGKRILPRDFQVYDDPREARFEDTLLAGHYLQDDEGTPARRVNLVENGKLLAMVTSRSPSKEFSESTGHARGFGRGRAGIGCLYVQADKGLSDAELREELLELARDEDLEYAIRIEAIRDASAMGSMNIQQLMAQMRRGGGGFGAAGLGDPVKIYKVYTEDGREECVRGCEFGDLTVRELKKIAAAGQSRTVHNRNSGAGSSIISPALLFEEVELFAIEAERDKKPITPAPNAREDKPGK